MLPTAKTQQLRFDVDKYMADLSAHKAKVNTKMDEADMGYPVRLNGMTFLFSCSSCYLLLLEDGEL